MEKFSGSDNALNLPTVGSYTVPSVASQLYSWIRTFWTKLYKDKAFVKYLQGSRALRYAQLYLDLLENIQLLDHTKAPVFHRERWYPLVLRKNRRNKSDASLLKLGQKDVVLSGEPIPGYEKNIKLGEYTSKDNCVTYALEDKVVSVLSCIVDNIADPKIVLKNGSDFRISEHSLVLKKEFDPFEDGGLFATFEVPETPDSEATEEAVLWACDTLIDKDFSFKYVGYAVGLQGESSEEYMNIVRSVWDATTDGLNPVHLRRVLAALCGVPSILEEYETVESVFSTEDFKQVVTDKNVYTLGADAELRDCVKAGNRLYRGDLFDTSVRIYPFVMDTARVGGYTEFTEEQFRKDVSSISVPAALIRSETCPGFYVGWDKKDVVCSGFDSNGNPKLSFDLGMDKDKEVAYWNGVWNKYEACGKSMSSCFDELENASITTGNTCGKVVPIKFFLRNLIGANTLIVFVDTDKIAYDAPLYDPNFFNALRKLIPAHIRLYFVEHGTAVDDEYGEEFQDSEDEATVTVSACSEIDEEFDRIEDEVINAKWQRRCHGRHEAEDDDYE